MIKQAIYAGSFDPWTLGHKFVFDASLAVFDVIHVVSATHHAKQSLLTHEARARVIAHSIDPFFNWWACEPPFHVGNKVIVTLHDGLISDYARDHGINHLIRGLRSTTDFEAEFNLYFSNQAINKNLHTWAILCPPQLLYCSSTFVKTVVGKPNVSHVGTSFVAQSLMLGWSRVIGQIFDLIELGSKHRFDIDPFNLSDRDLSYALQHLFSTLHQRIQGVSSQASAETSKILENFLKHQGVVLKSDIFERREFPEKAVNALWGILASCLERDGLLPPSTLCGVDFILDVAQNLGRTGVKLFHREDVLASQKSL